MLKFIFITSGIRVGPEIKKWMKDADLEKKNDE